MKITVRVELDPQSDKKGHQALYIRLTQNRKRVRISIGKSIDAKHWDRDRGVVLPSYPLAGSLNTLIRDKVNRAERFILDATAAGRPPTLAQVKAAVTGNRSDELKTIRSYADRLRQDMAGKFTPGTLAIYRYEAARIDGYDPGITFDRIDHRWLKGYEYYLRGSGLKPNSVHKAFKTLGKFFNSARRDGVTRNNPFEQFDKPKYRQGDRTYLTASEVQKIHDALNLPMDVRLRRTAVWFLFGCYSGLRYSDWARFNPAMIRGKDIVLRAKKNGQLVVMPIHTRLKEIIAMIGEVGPVEVEQQTNTTLKGLAELCGIDKHLTTHVARHSFAVRCAELGISIETTAELMGINVKTCAIYYKVTGTKVRAEMARWG